MYSPVSFVIRNIGSREWRTVAQEQIYTSLTAMQLPLIDTAVLWRVLLPEVEITIGCLRHLVHSSLY